MSSDDMSVSDRADRAEQRRQRILAKKKVRMAYAAGDRSVRPSEAPSEPIFIDSLPTHGASSRLLTQNIDRRPTGEEPHEDDASRPRADSEFAVPSLFDVDPPVGFTLSPLARSLLMIIAPILYVICIALAPSDFHRISAVELFLQIQIALNLHVLSAFFINLFRGQMNSFTSSGSWLSRLSTIATIASTLRYFQLDASLFAFSFLFSLRFANLAGYLRVL